MKTWSIFFRIWLILFASVAWVLSSCTDDDKLDVRYGRVTDRDGNAYRTVVIGDQEWMCENLRVSHYQNGDTIYEIWDGGTWAISDKGAWCYYNDDYYMVGRYGFLYNWHAVNDPRKIAPYGWRVASDADWQKLIERLGGENFAGGRLKEIGGQHWDLPNAGAADEIKFSARPGGYCNENKSFTYEGERAYFWTSTNEFPPTARMRYLVNLHGGVIPYSLKKNCGLSVRCVRDIF